MKKMYLLILSLVANISLMRAESLLTGGIMYWVNTADRIAKVEYYHTEYNYAGLTSANIASSVHYVDEVTDVIATVVAIQAKAFEGAPDLISASIPSSVDTIRDNAFAYCPKLKSVSISEGVQSVGGYLFYDSPSLTSIHIPNSVTELGGAFCHGCTSLTSASVGNGVKVLNAWSFAYCKNLTSMKLGSSIERIEYNAFIECSSLTSIELPKSINHIDFGVFAQCYALTSIDLPENLTTISGSLLANCTSLASVTIGKNVTSIGDGAFYNCGELTSIVLPASLTSIGKAFGGCKGLTSITCEATTPPVCYGEMFDSVDKSVCKLYVPAESLDLYKETAPWSYFFDNILPIPASPTAIDQITNNQSPITNKFLRDGQVLIQRGDKLYTIDGRLVR